MKALLPLFCLVAVVLAADSLPPIDSLQTQQLDAEIVRNQSELEQTRVRLQQVHDQLEQLGAREQVTLAKVNSYEEQITLTQRYVRQLRAQAVARTQEIATVALQTQQTTARIGQRKRDLGRRLVSIYKYGRTFPLEALLSTRSLPEMYRKMVYLRWIARADRKLAGELSTLNARLAGQRQQLVAAHTDLLRLQDEQARQQVVLTSAKTSESTLLRTIRSQRGEREGLAAELEQAAGRLQALITDLERRRSQSPTSGSEFQAGRGKLPWPLHGAVISGFGAQTHPKYGTKTSSLGIDIKSAPGTAVKATADGHVAYADQFMGYGNLVIVDHGGGFYTLYSNLSEMSVSVGATIAAGTTVGTANEYLHFEVRKDGKPVDPMAWLGN
jgi:murein hydrolase activator